MLILGLETSCDETGFAVYETNRGLLAHTVYSQVDLHTLYGGVVPELASRDHITRLVPLARETLAMAAIGLADLDGIAYTSGPGLAGALMAGAVFARSLAWSLGVPALGVHHMEGHLLSPMLEPETPDFPFVSLLVSGGHTLLVRVDGVGQYRILGESIDDAAGEAFDKTAKLLGLPYPGGPHLAKLATLGDEKRFTLPRPMIDRPGLDFSFSGLKTAAIVLYNGTDRSDQVKADVAAGFQLALVETLAIKCRRALEQESVTQLVVSGGVSANQRLRSYFASYFVKNASGVPLHVSYPRLEFCTDNGAMIALVGALRMNAGQSEALDINILPRWSLETLPGIGA